MSHRPQKLKRATIHISFLLACGCIATGQELRRSGFVGVRAGALTDELKAKLHLPVAGGIVVQDLVEGGSAKDAGLLPNDIITEINCHHISVEFEPAVLETIKGWLQQSVSK